MHLNQKRVYLWKNSQFFKVTLTCKSLKQQDIKTAETYFNFCAGAKWAKRLLDLLVSYI